MLFYGRKDRRFRIIVLATVKGQGHAQLSMRRVGGQYRELIHAVCAQPQTARVHTVGVLNLRCVT